MLALLLAGGQVTQGGLSVTLDDVTLTSEVHVLIRGYLVLTLDSVTMISQGTTLAGVESNERSYRVAAEDRAYRIAAESRVYDVKR